MTYREFRVVDVKELLRWWLRGYGYRRVGEKVGANRKTVGRYVECAKKLGLDRAGDDAQLTDEGLGHRLVHVG